MNSNQANESDGSYHIRVNPTTKKQKDKTKIETKEVKMTKSKTESKLKKLGVPASYIGITALIISILATQLGVCD